MAISAAELNLAEYRLTDLSEGIQPECDLIHEYLEDIRVAGKRVLEVGPGNGRTVAYLLKHGFTVDVIDRDSNVLQALSKNLSRASIDHSNLLTIQRDVAEYNPPIDSYGFISVSHVLHFCDRPIGISIIEKLLQALTVGGLILIRVHSSDHPGAIGAKSYIKHFFHLPDCNSFNRPGLTRMYLAHIEATTSRRSAINRAKAEGMSNCKDAIDRHTGKGAHWEIVFRRDPA